MDGWMKSTFCTSVQSFEKDDEQDGGIVVVVVAALFVRFFL